MKEYYSILLEDEEAQALLEITELIDEPIKPFPFRGNIYTAIEDASGDDTVTFWYENNHVVGLFFLSSELENLPDCVGNLIYLRFLVIISSEIRIIPTNLKKLQKLEYLEFSNDLDIDPVINIEFPDIFQFLNQLKTIRINGNFKIYFPPTFIEANSLEELNLEDCVFYTDYTHYSQHTREEINKISKLPKNIENLRSLKKIYLRYVNGIELPSSIINVPNLKELDLTHSKIINNEIVFNIRSLEILNLTYCGLKSVPKTIQHLKNLKILDFTHNYLQEIPFEITHCQKLEKLFLKWNRFRETFENWIKYLIQLPHLKHLAIEQGYLKFIPKELIEKKELEIKE